jgi:YjbE family integral membrane protein
MQIAGAFSINEKGIKMELLQTADFWVGLGLIVWINIILSGDNAVVIALAARSLPPDQQKKAVMFGSGAAVVLRIVLTIVAVWLLALPYLQIIGGVLLLWIGLQLLGDEDDGEGEEKSHGTLGSAVRTILLADLVMSLDNVIAVAAAAKGDMTLLVLGLAISIPIVIFGSTLMIKLMERFPIIVTLGAALIGWIGGETIMSDVALRNVLADYPWLHYAAAAAGAAFVIGVGKWLGSRHRASTHAVR